MKYYLRVNGDQEGWDLLKKDDIQTEEGTEDSWIATFYDKKHADFMLGLLNW